MGDYGDDLAYIHHHGFSEFIDSAAPGILETLWREGIRDGLVLDVGCGSGILARELTRSGFDVLGIDASPAMIALARNTAPDARFAIASFEDAELPRCKAITAVGEVLSYGDIRAFLPRAADALEPGGVLLFDAAASAIDDERRIDGDDWSVIFIRHGNTRRILTFRMQGEEMRRGEEVHALHFHDRETLRALLATHFTVRTRRSYGTRRLPPGHIVYICKRRPDRKGETRRR
ncbi:MAG TPA: class I SAM-dependent methyltransferase [Thermoanaerobaculia bacterium]|nr:class I SAM-dependent methyltransferase [Thermoanaerobaculia bacterium]